MLQIYNSLNKKKEDFTPLKKDEVSIYVCGMTVYDLCHIGHARVMVVFDMVARYFKAKGFKVHYVRNITDIDDKIITRANENGEQIETLTERFIDEMNRDAQALGVEPPNQEPKATEHMQEIIDMVQALIEREHAYLAENGDVYFDVSSFKDYGSLSGKQLEDLRAGERVAVTEAKDDPLDFVLWKKAKPEEPSWASPWGEGRPGWHIECSAMSTKCLGKHFDIHGGGQDLQFPHHENEIAQSVCATGEEFVNYWMHNGFVRVNEEKMSKSLGNFFTVREVLKEYQPEVIRFFILSSHYRSPLNYSESNLSDARAGLSRLYTALREVDINDGEVIESYKSSFFEFMDDDFNTAKAIALLHEVAKELNKAEATKASHLASTLKYLSSILGLLQDSPEAFLQGGTDAEGLSKEAIEAKIEERMAAKAAKDFTLADEIRDELAAKGIVLEDGAEGTTWRRE